MSSIKNISLAVLICIGMQVPMQVYSFDYALLTALKVCSRNVSSYVQKNLFYIKNCPLKVAALAVIGSVALCTYKYLWHKLYPVDLLAIDDPNVFCDLAERRIESIEGSLGNMRRCGQKFEAIKATIDAIRERLFEILVYGVYQDLQNRYQESADNAPLLKSASGVHSFLGLHARATFIDARRAVDNLQCEYQRKCQAGQEQVKDMDATLRQLNYIVCNPFGWKNYCAFVQGEEAVAQLPRVDKNRVLSLIMRVFNIKSVWPSQRRTAFVHCT